MTFFESLTFYDTAISSSDANFTYEAKITCGFGFFGEKIAKITCGFFFYSRENSKDNTWFLLL